MRAVHDDHVAAGDLAAEPLARRRRPGCRARAPGWRCGWCARPPRWRWPSTFSRSSPAVCEGARSRATTIDGRLQAAEVLAPLAEQVAQQALLDVLEVARPLEQVGIAGFLERLAVAPQDLRDGVLGREQAVGDERDDLLAELRVLEHVAVDLEDVGGLRAVAELLAQLVAELGDLARAIRRGPCRSARSRGGPRRA